MTDRPTPSGQPGRAVQHQNQMIADHLALARSIAREYRGRRLSREDLRGVAELALVEAARAYDADGNPGVPFEVFARVLIRSRIQDALYRAPVVHMGRDDERRAMRGELEGPRPHDVAIEGLGVMPKGDDGDERSIEDALRHCTEDERVLSLLLLEGYSVPQAARLMGLALFEARATLDGARRALAVAFDERGFPMSPLSAGMN